MPCVFCVLDSKTCFGTNQTFSLQKPFSVRSLLFLMPFLAANLIKQCAVLTLNWIPLTDFRSTSLLARCVTNSVWIVHLYLWFRHYHGILHQGNLKLTGFFPSLKLWTEGNARADKEACQPRPANVASVPSAVLVQPVTIAAVDTNKTYSLSPLMAMAFILFATAGKKMLSERASFFANLCNAIDNSSNCESEDDQSFMVWVQLCTCSVFEGFVHVQCTM